MSDESATTAVSPAFQAAFDALANTGKHIARESWEGKKKVVGVEAPKLRATRPPCLLVEVQGQAGQTPMPVTEELAAATDWVVLP